MNCMETRALVEDALDETLSGNQKRALDLHLSRCDGCRAYFAAERNEHRRWFKAMNEPYARRRLPDGFADNFVAAIANANAVPQRRWAFVGLFRRIAAVVAAMLLFAGLSYAAVVAVDELGGSEEEKAVVEMKLPESSVVSEGGLSSDAAISDGDGSPAASSLSISPEQQTGGSNMIKPKAA
ncbi:MAG: zf-HC2 domain-containing protein, partial [Kiritimatiellae bacterium]|nr:zf-HC2 domain-containing protein [Kiritimatiellia bacterium]